MKDLPVPTFSSPELQKAVNDARPFLEGIEQARNNISNDIKTLEAYLGRLDLKTSFRFPLGESLMPHHGDTKHDIAVSIDNSGGASGIVQEEALVWDPAAGGKPRLLYEVSQWDGYVDVDAPGGPFFKEDPPLKREAKPLIETKFEIRKRVWQNLPRFVTALTEHFAVEKPNLEVPF
jgi:hypothetical protein